MPENILIATLGDHPAVVTGMIKALRQHAGIEVNTLHVLHPQDTGKYIGHEGVRLIRECLPDEVQFEPIPLGFSDPNTYEASLEFLRILTNILERYDDEARYNVYLSLAGGRKNMSALMALTTQFFPAVRGLYHLLDEREGTDDAVFPSIEAMELYLPEEQVRSAMDPPLEHVKLIAIPYPGPFAQAYRLRQFLKNPDDSPPVLLSPEAEQFFERIFNPSLEGRLLEVWLSKTAWEQYRRWKEQGSDYAREFLKCFEQMRDPYALKERMHGTFDEFHFFKRRRTRERPFYYTLPNPIHLYPQKTVEQVIVCGLSVEQGNGQYDPTVEEWLQGIDRQPYKRLTELYSSERILLVPLGRSPMVVTQTYTLLQESEEEGRPRIPLVAVVYPEQSVPIRNAVLLLEKQFRRRKVKFKKFPIKGLVDIDSTEACETYLRTLLRAIEQLRYDHPTQPIALSLSGGRKGMSALTLFAAQKAGIERVYHTLITDPELDQRIESENSIKELERLGTDTERARRLFLDTYDRGQFTLFTIPVIRTVQE